MKASLGDRVTYDQFDVGWDPKLRKFGEMKVLSLEDLLAKLLEQKTKVLITLGAFLSDHLFSNSNVHLPSLLAQMGINFLMIDVDIFDYFFDLRKSISEDDRSPRMTIYPHVQKVWDREYQNKNARYYLSL